MIYRQKQTHHPRQFLRTISLVLSIILIHTRKSSCFSMKLNTESTKLPKPNSNKSPSSPSNPTTTTTNINNNNKSPSPSSSQVPSSTYNFSIPLTNERPKPTTFLGTLNELWNDPRPVTSVMSSNDRSYVGTREDSGTGCVQDIPYCIVSDEFKLGNNDNDNDEARFQVLLYPRGRFIGASTPDASDGSSVITGPAGTYLRYIPKEYGNEIDVAWKVRLIDTRTEQALPIGTSGGLPKSPDTWSAALTFCTDNEAIESVGRVADWGSSDWLAKDVCESLGNVRADVEMTVFETRRGESMYAWPLGSKGGMGAVQRAKLELGGKDWSPAVERTLTVGEVIVPVFANEEEVEDGASSQQQLLEEKYVYSGIDYRIMTMSDKDGNQIFSTSQLPINERQFARCALRPCGFRSQNQFWRNKGMTSTWPTEVDIQLIAPAVLTRFNRGAAIPRLISAVTRDWVAYVAAIALAIAPIPLVLLGRNVVSLYVIPSASMDPTLLKGDVLLVEKLPGVLKRSKRGDVILFRPNQSLTDIIERSGGSPISSSSLFVKRIVGLPGDVDIVMDDETNEVTVGGNHAVGPDRNLCDDEPLRIIDRFLENGKGKVVDKLGEDEIYVLGDCKAVSVDSRVFGVLSKDDVIGRPLARTWPLNRMTTKKL